MHTEEIILCQQQIKNILLKIKQMAYSSNFPNPFEGFGIYGVIGNSLGFDPGTGGSIPSIYRI
jgi:hypothetical protein